MKLLVILCVFTCISFGCCQKCRRLKRDLAQAECLTENVMPCYDPCNKKSVQPEDCKKHSHCCMKNCTCIMKGGSNIDKISAELRMPEDDVIQLKFLKNCCEDSEMRHPKPPQHTAPRGYNCAKIQDRISNLALCPPAQGYEDEVQDCYSLITKRPIPYKSCGKGTGSHCCIHNCRCVVKGAGTSFGAISDKCQQPEPIKKTSSLNIRLIPGCIPSPPACPTETTRKLPSQTTLEQNKPRDRPTSAVRKPRTTTTTTTKRAKAIRKTKAPTTRPPPSCKAVRSILSKEACIATNVMPCFDLCTKRQILAKDCKKNSHCCLKNCTCIMKGGGAEAGKIPEAYLPEKELPSKKVSKPPAEYSMLPGCVPTPKPVTKEISTTTPSKSTKTTKRMITTAKLTKKPSMKNKKPNVRRPRTKKPPTTPRPTRKEVKLTSTKKTAVPRKPRPTPTKRTRKTTTTKKPCIETTSKSNKVSFGLFSQLSFLLGRLGIDSTVVKNTKYC